MGSKEICFRCTDSGYYMDVDHIKDISKKIELLESYSSSLSNKLCRELKIKKLLELKDAENKYSCNCTKPALMGHDDADAIPYGYARCLNCDVLFRLKGKE